VSRTTGSLKRSVCVAIGCALVVAATAAQPPNVPQSSYQLPPTTQVIEYLLQSVNWYHHVYVERQVASDPADLMFLDNHQALEEQIVKLSFEFARADAALTRVALQNKAPTSSLASDLSHFIDLKNRNEQVSHQIAQNISILNQKIRVAGKSDRKKLESSLDDAQSRLELLHAVSLTVNDLIAFLQSAGTDHDQAGNLASTIDNLAQSMPELSISAPPSAQLPHPDPNARMTDGREDGIFKMLSEISAQKRKLRVIDEKIILTQNMALRLKSLRTPMAGFITRVLQSAATNDLQTGELSLLHEQKSRLDALTANVKELSPVLLALDKQKDLLAVYESHLLVWRIAVAGEYRKAWKELTVHLLVMASIMAVLIGIGEFARRLALRRVHDPNRRQIVGMVHRLVTLVAITAVALFGVNSEFRSLATYLGLLTAGVAVALQNVILASLGYLLLVGKRGIKIGDRVGLAAITGDVIDMGLLQFQLREFDVQEQKFTGRVVTFSNSVVFLPATGLLKLESAHAKTSDATSAQRRN
jgi:Mechanosensitive ion channel